uniref:Putative secreted peptide n=1 Tax=Anopheles braziliensis TaxID=58242 RepID=A0A2M3ZRV1_9DIPT
MVAFYVLLLLLCCFLLVVIIITVHSAVQCVPGVLHRLCSSSSSRPRAVCSTVYSRCLATSGVFFSPHRHPPVVGMCM